MISALSDVIGVAEMRIGTVQRVTGETDVKVRLDLDGSGQCQASTGVPFLDHMLHQISSHGLIDLEINAVGDTHIDDHHTNEDVGIAVGQALAKALGTAAVSTASVTSWHRWMRPWCRWLWIAPVAPTSATAS